MGIYNGIFRCGHEGEVRVVNMKSSEKQHKADWMFENLECPECRKKARLEEIAKENAKASIESADMELPELKGSEKQIVWANTIRVNLLESISFKYINDSFKDWQIDKTHEERLEIKEIIGSAKDEFLDYIKTSISNKTSAAWFINNRYGFSTELEKIYEEFLIMKKTPAYVETPDEVKEEATVIPEEVKETGIVEIEVKEDKISAKYEKNENFRSIVKSLNYVWKDGAWTRKINELTGSVSDRAAELGNKLLLSGFSVRIFDGNIRRAAIAGKYEPECNRWVRWNEDKKTLSIRWWEDNEKIYNQARKIRSAKWDSETRSILVNVHNYEEVNDFAEAYGFKITKNATAKINEYAKKMECIKKVSPIVVEEKESTDKLKEILCSESSVLDDLKD